MRCASALVSGFVGHLRRGVGGCGRGASGGGHRTATWLWSTTQHQRRRRSESVPDHHSTCGPARNARPHALHVQTTEEGKEEMREQEDKGQHTTPSPSTSSAPPPRNTRNGTPNFFRKWPYKRCLLPPSELWTERYLHRGSLSIPCLVGCCCFVKPLCELCL
jgi:hypothetical protein